MHKHTGVRCLLPLAFAMAMYGCGEEPAPGADLVFVNANGYTLEADQPWAEAVAISGNEIVYVGDNAGAEQFIGKNTERVDLDGKMLLPGFIDAHMHPISGGVYAKALSLDTFGDIDGWVAAIDEYARANPDASLLFGYGFLASTFGPTGPTRQLIDAVVSDRPVLILDEGFHGAWANSRALEMLNITQDTPDPAPGFSYYKRDANGDATGYLLEKTSSMAVEGLQAITEDVITEGTAYVIETLNSFGVTSVFDAGAINFQQYVPNVLRRLEASGELTVRMVGSYRPNGTQDVADAVQRTIDTSTTLIGDHYHYRQLKIMDDGTIEGRTAAMFEDYQGEPGNSGATVYTQDEMTRMVLGAAKQNIDVHVHGLGERAVHESLNAFAAAREAYPDSTSRYAICHIEVITDQDLPRFAELDVIAQSSPFWASFDYYGKQFVSDDQFQRYWRFKSLADLGVRLTWGSDYPATGGGLPAASPVVQMETGVTRQELGNPDAPVQPRETERLDMAAMIRGYTIDAAYQLHMEDEIGSLVAGKKADLVVLDKNLFDVDPYEIHKTAVVMTIMDGDVVYTAVE